MPRMVRKQICIESRQENSLKKQVRDSGITEPEVIRWAIDRQMTSVRLSVRDLKAWERERAFVAKRMVTDIPREAVDGGGKTLTRKGWD